MLALAQGTVDVAANQWTSDDDSTLTQMLHKGMLKNADGTPMKKDDFRIIHKSAPIINGPYAYNSRPAGRPEGRDRARRSLEAPDQGQGGVRPPVRRPEEGLPSGHHQGLGRDHRADQVRRRCARRRRPDRSVRTSEAGSMRPGLFLFDRVQISLHMTISRLHPARASNSPRSTTPIARRSRASGCA